MILDLPTLREEFQSLCVCLSSTSHKDKAFLQDIQKESKMEINDFSLTEPDPALQLKRKTFALTTDILYSHLHLINLQIYFLDFHAEKQPLLTNDDEALNYWTLFEVCQESDDYQSFFEAYLYAFKNDFSTAGLHDFARDHYILSESFKSVVYNAQERKWGTSYQASLLSYKDACFDLSRCFLNSARFNIGILPNGETSELYKEEDLMPSIYSGLENAKVHLETSEAIDKMVKNQKDMNVISPPTFIHANNRLH